jgi:sialate O-acetylesterase
VKAEPAFKPIADRWKKVAADASAAQEKYQQQVENWKNAVTKAKAKGEKAPSRPRAPRGPNSPHNVSVLYNGMIAPLVGYAIRGAIWYQGESNASRAYQYSKIFPAMITDWRDRWGQGDFPFLFVQLANFSVRNSVTWAELREAQNVALDLPSTGVAVAIDIGNPRDIHPRNKQEVGRRLALSAVGQFHGKDLVWSGPSYTGMKVRGKVARLSFNHVAGGMAARGGGELKGFTIAGADKKFVPARARIVKDTVLVEGDVARPVAVRYAWESNPDCNLINDAGLPASPFRTDDWEWMTANAK